MYLKKIKLAGFKSFVDPTYVQFRSNRVGIVGPNGCGKSNIIDAVRWVMGESSARQLRGESLEDVIFNGTTTRQPVGQATIELLFDNTEKTITGKYAQYDEISIRRLLNRDGTSLYYLNNSRCRRKDIVDIFIGTGLGPRSYAIIEQGTISQIIEAKPEELRTYLEETAGIAKYKERRRETENRMQSTRENLARLQDILVELDQQLQHLQQQAKVANRFQQLRIKERLFKAQIQGLIWQELNNEKNNLADSIEAQENLLTKTNAELGTLEVATLNFTTQRDIAREEFNNISNESYNISNRISTVEQKSKQQQDRLQQLKNELLQNNKREIDLKMHLANDQTRITQSQSNLQELQQKTTPAQMQLQTAQNQLTQAEQKLYEWQLNMDLCIEESAENNKQIDLVKTQIKHLEYNINNATNHLTKLKNEQQELEEFADLPDEISDLKIFCETINAKLEQTKYELLERRTKLNHNREYNNKINTELNKNQQSLQKLQAQLASLEILQKAALHKSNVDFNNWLKQHNLLDKQRVAQNIQVTKGWEKAVETVLTRHLEAVCIDSIDDISNILASLTKGKVAFVSNQNNANTNDNSHSLASKIKTPLATASNLLSYIYIAETIEQALQLKNKLQAHESVITKDGIWVGRDWLILNREEDSQNSVLMREQEMRELNDQIQNMQQKVKDLDNALQKNKQQILTAEKDCENLQNTIDEENIKYSTNNAELAAKKTRFEHMQKRALVVLSETKDQETKLQNLQKEIAEERIVLPRLEVIKQQQDEKQKMLLAKREQQREQYNRNKNDLEIARQELENITTQSTLLQNQIQNLTHNIERTTPQLNEITTRMHIVQENILTIEQEIAPALHEELESFLAQKILNAEKLIQAKQNLDKLEQELQYKEKQRNLLHKEELEIHTNFEHLKAQSQTLQVRSEACKEKMQELGFELDTILKELPQDTSKDNLAVELENLSKRIDRIGPINLAAVSEFEQKQERKTYLDAQCNDLTEALTTLESAIEKIDQETKERFKQTFYQVNTEFQRLFPIIFEGGKASLIMTEDNILKTGVTITAQPPGKKNSTIHLLSGGEKALTAIALVFAIFQLNPAPFCMLDEVDAPLDDNNVIRFCNIVKEMSAKTQFIFVTHNKVTMEMAHQLTGITMQEPGVSRVVAVDIEEALKMVEQ